MLKNIFAIAGTALSAQTIRMNTTASNLANAGSVSPTEAEAFRAKRPVFRALVEQADLNAGFNTLGGVKVKEVVAPVQCAHMRVGVSVCGYVFVRPGVGAVSNIEAVS